MPMPTEGAAAPDFTLPDQNGNPVHLAELRGRKVVLYFYPKDDTPGCTIEACGFRDSHASIQATGAVVLGVSPDDAQSHQKFIGKFSLPFTLLSDVDHQVAEAYGAWGEKNMYGRPYMGILRSTFLIDEQGNVQKAWPKVSPQGHDQEVLAAIRGEAAPGKAEVAPAAASNAAPKAAEAKPAPAESPKKAARPAAAKKAQPVAGKKPAAKTAAKKAGSKRTARPVKKTPAKSARKAPAKKAAKPAARKGSAKKAAKPVARKAATKKAARRPAAKKSPARRPAKKPARKARR
jgi:peroxiredoxin Q/BCP